MTELLNLVGTDIGAPLVRVGAGEYAGACPSCGGRDRFRVWPARVTGKVPGAWWCRRCGKRGDTLAYLQEFRGMKFPEACAVLGIEPGSRPAAAARLRERRPAPDPLAGRGCPSPPDLWQQQAAQLTRLAEANLWSVSGAAVRAYLASRGISESTAKRYRLGWVPAPMFRDRAAWGIPEEPREDGRRRTLLIPPGVLIPCTDDAGRVLRLRVRYWTAEHGSTPPPDSKRDKPAPKYQNVRGSAMRTLVCGAGPAVVVVESDLDALLLAQDAGDLVVPVALGSADVRPDEHVAELMRAARVVLVALDTDDAGGRAAWGKWASAKNAEVWPVPARYGKDPGEARANGLILRAWILAGLHHLGAVPAALAKTTTAHDELSDPPAGMPVGDGQVLPGAEAAIGALPASCTTGDAWQSNRPTAPGDALAGWLRAMQLPTSPRQEVPWRPASRRAAPQPTAPPYCLDLADCIQRMGTGAANIADAGRLLAWIPSARGSARIVREQDRERGDGLIRELLELEAVCRAAVNTQTPAEAPAEVTL